MPTARLHATTLILALKDGTVVEIYHLGSNTTLHTPCPWIPYVKDASKKTPLPIGAMALHTCTAQSCPIQCRLGRPQKITKNKMKIKKNTKRNIAKCSVNAIKARKLVANGKNCVRHHCFLHFNLGLLLNLGTSKALHTPCPCNQSA